MTVNTTFERSRSHLYVPADNAEMLAKATSRGADALILDLEDAVATSRKSIARAAAVDFASAERAEGPELWVRVNEGNVGQQDIEACVAVDGITGIWIPKAEPGFWFERMAALVAGSGKRLGLLVESAGGIAGLRDFPELSSDSLVQIGEADLAASLRITAREDQMVVYRSMVVLECARRGLSAPIAPVAVSFENLETYRDECERMREWGFVGRACIHPAQVAEANLVWGISDADLQHAVAIIAEFEASAAQGVGVFLGPDGAMVDKATVRWARSVIDGSTPK